MRDAAERLRRTLRSIGPARLATVSPWAAGAGFGVTLLCMFALSRLAMLGLAVRQGYLEELALAHVLWLGPALGYDLALAFAVSLAVGTALRGLPRARPVVLGLAYFVTLVADLVCLVSVPTYGALHTTL